MSSERLTDLSDSTLLDRFLTNGDEAAFAELLHRHSRLVYGACHRLLTPAEDVEDAFQATFLTLLQKGGTIRADRFGSWLYRVAYRVSQRISESRKGQVAFDDIDEPVDDLEAFQRIELREVQRTLEEEIDQLPERLRVPLVMFHLENSDRAEIAVSLGCSESCVKGRLERARRLLRNRMLRRGVRLSATVAALQLAASTHATAAPLIQETASMAQGWIQNSLPDATLSHLSNSIGKELSAMISKSTLANIVASIFAVTVIYFATQGVSAHADDQGKVTREIQIAVAQDKEQQQADALDFRIAEASQRGGAKLRYEDLDRDGRLDLFLTGLLGSEDGVEAELRRFDKLVEEFRKRLKARLELAAEQKRALQKSAKRKQKAASPPVLLYFSSQGCPICAKLSPKLARLRKSGLAVVRLDIAGNDKLRTGFNVTESPTLVLLTNGKETERRAGVAAESLLDKLSTKRPVRVDVF